MKIMKTKNDIDPNKIVKLVEEMLAFEMEFFEFDYGRKMMYSDFETDEMEILARAMKVLD